MDTTSLKLGLLSFLEQKGAYNASGQVRLPGDHWADLKEFLPQSGADQQQLEELLQQMRAGWQVAALWFNNSWLAFYTPLGHEELNRLRGHTLPPPVAAPMDEEQFWHSLARELERRGESQLASQVAQLHGQPAIMQATRTVLQKYI